MCVSSSFSNFGCPWKSPVGWKALGSGARHVVHSLTKSWPFSQEMISSTVKTSGSPTESGFINVRNEKSEKGTPRVSLSWTSQMMLLVVTRPACLTLKTSNSNTSGSIKLPPHSFFPKRKSPTALNMLAVGSFPNIKQILTSDPNRQFLILQEIPVVIELR